MKKLYFIIASFMMLSSLIYSQNFVQSPLQAPTCYGSCNGTVVYTSTLSGGPFSAVLTNTSSCPNTTVQTSSGGTITITNLCECASEYSVSFYNSSMVLVGYELLQVPVTATAPLVLLTPTLDPAACPSCCNGTLTYDWSGGFAPAPNNPTITLDGNDISGTAPYSSVCVGQHTLCVKDLANCEVCTTFSMNYVISAGITEYSSTNAVEIFPVPANDLITIKLKNLSLTSISSIGIIDISGKCILQSSVNKTDGLKIPVQQLAQGFYFIEGHNSSGQIIFRQKIIKS